MTPAPLAIHADPTVSCGTVLWRYCGRLYLTIVVKAVFAVVHEGVATPVGPGEIVAEDRHVDGSPLRSVEAASDLAPYLGRCDVLFAGHAYALGGPAASASVRLRMSRYGRWLLDKTLYVYGDRDAAGAPVPFSSMPIVYERAVGGPGTSNPAGSETPNLADPQDAGRPAGFGPIARRWPTRRLALGPIHPGALKGPIADIPEAMPVEYFQAAPRDQQLEPLRGGEWLVLEGLDPTRRRVQTRLPASRGVARVVLRRLGAPATGIAVDLACDTVAIDGDRQTFSLSWRGRYEVPEGEAALPSLVVLAALEAPGVPADWTQLLATAAPAPPPAFRPRQTTMTLQPAQLAAIPSKAALPFMPSGAPTAPEPEEEEPMTLVPGGAAAREAQAAFAFARSGARPPAPTAPEPEEEPSTLAPGLAAAGEAKAALPFARSGAPSRASVTRDGEPSTLEPGGAAAREARAALPFAPSGVPAKPPSTDATPWSTQRIRPAPVPERHAVPAKPPVMSFGLGMRLSSAPLSVHPMPLPEDADDGISDMDTLDPNEPFLPEPPAMTAPRFEPPPPPMIAAPRFESLPPPAESLPPPPEMAAPPSEPPPREMAAPPSASPPPPVVAEPRSDPWARPPAPPSQPPPPLPPPPKTFERPAVAAMKGSFYSKFVRK